MLCKPFICLALNLPTYKNKIKTKFKIQKSIKNLSKKKKKSSNIVWCDYGLVLDQLGSPSEQQHNLQAQREPVQGHLLPLHISPSLVSRLFTQHPVCHRARPERAALGRRVLSVLADQLDQLGHSHVSSLLHVSHQLRSHVRHELLVSKPTLQYHRHSICRLHSLLLLVAHSNLDLVQFASYDRATLQTSQLCLAQSRHGLFVSIQRRLRPPICHLVPHHALHSHHHQQVQSKVRRNNISHSFGLQPQSAELHHDVHRDCDKQFVSHRVGCCQRAHTVQVEKTHGEKDHVSQERFPHAHHPLAHHDTQHVQHGLDQRCCCCYPTRIAHSCCAAHQLEISLVHGPSHAAQEHRRVRTPAATTSKQASSPQDSHHVLVDLAHFLLLTIPLLALLSRSTLLSRHHPLCRSRLCQLLLGCYRLLFLLFRLL